MRDVEIPKWLKGLPFAPEYRPTDTEFADPIAYISKIEKEASAFGICKVIPPLPKPSKKYVLFNLNNSLSKCPELGSDVNVLDASKTANGDEVSGGNVRAVFTTRHQELGKRSKEAVQLQPSHMQVWQSGEIYTLEQFESKSKAFAKSQLGIAKEVSPLVIEALFWKAASEKPIYVEYANDVPGSGFGEPEGQFRYLCRQKKRKKMTFNRNNRGSSDSKKYHVDTLINISAKDVVANCNISTRVEAPKASPIVLSDQTLEKGSNVSNGMEGSAGWRLTNSPWNLQVIARSPGSLTRFMPDDIPGVTSPMVYIGMLFSWFAWHVEDHELHSMNFLHTGSSKTWYAVPGDYAFTFEEVIRTQAYGGNIDRLAALSLLGQKTTLFSPQEVVSSGIPCCRLVQNPGEFVVTFPRAYHIGFSHGFNCGEAANFGTPQWLAVAKEAAVRRATMNYLPMLSHQQLLYLLTMSFFSRIPRSLLPGVRSSRLRDRQKEERELLVKKAFIEDILHENHQLSILLGKNSSYYAVLWDMESLPSSSKEFESHSDNVVTAPGETVCSENESNLDLFSQMRLYVENANDFYVDDYELSSDFQVDSGTLPCVACGILGFPFMSIVQPSEKASIGFLPADPEMTQELSVVRPVVSHLPFNLDSMVKVFNPDELENQDIKQPKNTSISCKEHVMESSSPRVSNLTKQDREFLVDANILLSDATEMMKPDESSLRFPENRAFSGNELAQSLVCPEENQSLVPDYLSTNDLPFSSKIKCGTGWNTSNGFLRPRIFCLEHAIQIEERLHSRGGANLLVICHSDFLKIKAHAAAIAEEMGTLFKYNDIPLDNASQKDLNLINLAIDEEGQDECEEDWTSKLSINMQYSIKLRKSLPSKEMQPLALQGLFSDSSSRSNSSNLNWLSKKSRSKRNRSHPVQGKLSGSLQVKNSDNLEVKSDIQMGRKENKLIQYSRRKFQSKSCNIIEQRIASVDTGKQMPSSVLAVYSRASATSSIEVGQCDQSENENTRDRIFASSLKSTLKNDPQTQDTSKNLSESSVQLKEVPSRNAALLHENAESFKPTEMTMKNPRSDCTEDDSQIHQGFNFNEERSHKRGKCYNQTCDSLVAVAFPGSEIKEIETENKIIDDLNFKNKDQNLATADSCRRQCGIKPSEDVLMEDASHIAYFSGSSADDLGMKRVGEQREKTFMEISPGNDELADFVPLDNEVQHSQTTVANIENKPASSSATLEFPSKLLDESLEVSGEIHSTEVAESVGANCMPKNGKLGDVESTTGGSRSSARNGRKTEVEQQDLFGINGFIKGPCEGLRPRAQKDGSRNATDSKRTVENKRETRARKPAVSQIRESRRGLHRCDIESCRMSFQTKGELLLHKGNRCPHEGCGKKFSSHKYAIFHQRVHDDDRPLKCTWKGCSMSFKWTWARTEHLRVHTGDRPYECKYEGCGLTFRFVSDFSRHRRKTGHYVNLPA